MTSAEKYLDWLVAEISMATEYHNHKETMAWIATSLYVSGSTLLGFYTPKIITATSFIERFFVVLFFVILAILIYFFVRFQFLKRSESADEIEGLMKVTNKLCASDWSPEIKDTEIIATNHYPKFVQEEIDKSKSLGRSISDWLKTDFVSYFAITFFMVVSICLAIRK